MAAETETLACGDLGLDRVGLGARQLAGGDRGLDLILERALEGVLERARRDAEASGGVVDHGLALVGAPFVRGGECGAAADDCGENDCSGDCDCAAEFHLGAPSVRRGLVTVEQQAAKRRVRTVS